MITSAKSKWSRRYTCNRCDVEWVARLDEPVPDTCFMCFKNDMTSVWTQAGSPVMIPNADPEAMENVAHRQWIEETRRKC